MDDVNCLCIGSLRTCSEKPMIKRQEHKNEQTYGEIKIEPGGPKCAHKTRLHEQLFSPYRIAQDISETT